MKDIDLKALLKRVVELVMPDLRAYYRVVRKAKVVKTYASDGQYWADVQPLRNDESVDESEPVIPHVEIPVIWAGENRGMVCPPAVGTFCDLEYYDGDPNYPRISNFRWYGMGAPEVEIGGLIIQREPGTHIKIDSANNIIHVTPSNRQNSVGGGKTEGVGGSWTISAGGDANISAGGSATVSAGSSATISAPQINLAGNISMSGTGGGTGTASMQANMTITGKLTVNGDIYATGTIIDEEGNTDHHEGHGGTS